MTLGTMANINASLDFDTAEILAADYFKTLKKESTRDEVNFEELEIEDKKKQVEQNTDLKYEKTAIISTIEANIENSAYNGDTKWVR